MVILTFSFEKKAKEEEFSTLDKFGAISQEVADDVHARIAAANKNDPLGYLTLPLMLWTLEDSSYDNWIRKSMPKAVRAILCNYVFYYKVSVPRSVFLASTFFI